MCNRRWKGRQKVMMRRSLGGRKGEIKEPEEWRKVGREAMNSIQKKLVVIETGKTCK